MSTTVMDTPAITPETLLSASPESSSTPHQHSLPQPKMPPNDFMDLSHANFFARSLRPLSPPESPFNFNAAFSKPQSRTSTAPASPHFELPTLVKRASPPPNKFQQPSQPQSQSWTRNLQTKPKTEDNPYFPSIRQQERDERRTRDAARLPHPSPPLVPSVPPCAHEDPSSHVNDDHDVEKHDEKSAAPAPAPAPAPEATMRLDLSAVQRRRALRLCVSSSSSASASSSLSSSMDLDMETRKMKLGQAELPPSPESLPAIAEVQMPPPVSAEYSRNMAVHLRERMKRKSVRPTPWGNDFRFEW